VSIVVVAIACGAVVLNYMEICMSVCCNTKTAIHKYLLFIFAWYGTVPV
jgi:hypothetical protein